MVAVRSLPEALPSAAHVDQRVHLQGMSWQVYEALLAWRGESSAIRMTYLEGVLELMTPSIDHEGLKKRLARLVEAWADETGAPLEGFGSWTIKDPSVERGAEPDECYILGDPRGRSAPDVAIEVVWTGGGISKLEVYRKLRVREVWIWQAGRLHFHLLRGETYVVSARSELLPAFDPALACRCMAAESQIAAVKMLRDALRTKPARGKRSRRATKRRT